MHDNVVLQKKIAAGKKKGSTIIRDEYVTVKKIDPLESVSVALEGLMNEKKLLPSKECYREP